MGIMDLLEDYHPERLSMDEVYTMVEDARYGMSACEGTPVFRKNSEFDEYVKRNGWLIYAMDTRPNRGEIKAMDLDGNVVWVNIVDHWARPGRHTLMVIPPNLSLAPIKDIIRHAINYHDTSYEVTGANFMDIHEYLRPVCELSSDYSAPVVYDETTGTFHRLFKLGKVSAASYARYIAKEYGIEYTGRPDKTKPNTVFSRANDRLTDLQAVNMVFQEIVSMSYNRVRSVAAKSPMTLDATGLVSMVSGQNGGVIITSLSGHRKELDVNFAKAKEFMLSMDGKKVRVTHEDDGFVNYFTVHSSITDKLVVTSIRPIGK